MRITITQRLLPFSHLLGTPFLLPGSSLCFHIFPVKIQVTDLAESKLRLVAEIPLALQGPIEDFTVIQNLERQHLCVWGYAKKGFIRYRICHDPIHPQGFSITTEKHPDKISVAPEFESSTHFHGNPLPFERLSLGSHKAQDWALIQRRKDFTEIFPLWYCLGQITPSTNNQNVLSGNSLFNACAQAIAERKTTEILSAFDSLFLAAFEGGLSPTLTDRLHQGFSLPAIDTCDPSISSLHLLTMGAKLIRSLFIQEQDQSLLLLPALPPTFHAGRMVHIQSPQVGMIDLEWSKKQTRRLILHPNQDNAINLQLQKEIKRFRLRTNDQEKGVYLPNGASLSFSANKTYYLDHFEK